MNEFKDKMFLITGASGGIGAAFASRLAKEGSNLILVARSEDKLLALANKLSIEYKIRCEVIVADLSLPESAQNIFEETQKRNLQIDVLINNAGFGTYGEFETLDPVKEHKEIMLNVASLVAMTHQFIPQMLARKQGAIINLASVAGYQPIPYMAVYAATKAFVLSFSEALWGEYHTEGISVLALSPGETATDFFKEIGPQYGTHGKMETPEQVVTVGLLALLQRRSSVISGKQNNILANSSRFAPRKLVVLITMHFLKLRK